MLHTVADIQFRATRIIGMDKLMNKSGIEGPAIFYFILANDNLRYRRQVQLTRCVRINVHIQKRSDSFHSPAVYSFPWNPGS